MHTDTAKENKPVYISLFPSGKKTRNAKTVKIDELFKRIKEGTSKQQIEKIRQLSTGQYSFCQAYPLHIPDQYAIFVFLHIFVCQT